jgi:Arc/MetJ-type ribon-helix-helix transcriptional regulator
MEEGVTKDVSDRSKRERITVRLTRRYMQLLESLIDGGIYNSRNEAIRDALRVLFEYHGLSLSGAGSPQPATRSMNPSDSSKPKKTGR